MKMVRYFKKIINETTHFNLLSMRQLKSQTLKWSNTTFRHLVSNSHVNEVLIKDKQSDHRRGGVGTVAIFLIF